MQTPCTQPIRSVIAFCIVMCTYVFALLAGVSLGCPLASAQSPNPAVSTESSIEGTADPNTQLNENSPEFSSADSGGDFGEDSTAPPGVSLPKDSYFAEFDALNTGALNSIPCSFSATYQLEEGTRRGVLRVTAQPDPGFHIFSVTQSEGPSKTEILAGEQGVKLGIFEPDAPPDIEMNLTGFEGIPVESHHGSVTWASSISVPDSGSAPGNVKLIIHAQVCSDQCVPIRDHSVEATFVGFYPSRTDASASAPFREPGSLSEWSIELSQSQARPGDTLDLFIQGTPDESFHLYKYDGNNQVTEARTLIVLQQKARMTAGAPTADKPIKSQDFGGGIHLEYYEGAVRWRIPLTVPVDAIPNHYQVSGLVGYQACNEGSCDQPRGLEFHIPLEITDQSVAQGPSVARILAVPHKTITSLNDRNAWIDSKRIELTLAWHDILGKFCVAMLGGLILNVMPCVLPVIGLKILGFVNEAAGDQRTASRLTLVYALGMIALILSLGLASVIVRHQTGQAFGWGEQFGSILFRIVATSFMFALALSFLGVWDVPIPGFATGGKMASLAGKDGMLGAFFKGIVTTLLATPCSAPFLGSVLVVALTQPSWVVLTIFAGAGIGMALPYLLLSVYPGLLAFIPKPGPWMETFREFLAFPMLLAVVLFVNGFSGDQKMGMLASLIFVWFACWLIGRVPAWAERGPKLRAWGIGTAVVLLGTYGSFYAVRPSSYALAWRDYDEQTLDRLVGEGKTVLIDFTAQWCYNCKLNLNNAIHTQKVKEWVDQNNVVAMEADLTDYPAHIKAKLTELQSISIPVLAIYKPGDTQTPIVLRDLLSEKDVLSALQEAKEFASIKSGITDSDEMEIVEESVDDAHFGQNAAPPTPLPAADSDPQAAEETPTAHTETRTEFDLTT